MKNTQNQPKNTSKRKRTTPTTTQNHPPNHPHYPLNLSLSLSLPTPLQQPPQQPPSPPPRRRKPPRKPTKPTAITPPYPWTTNHRAKVHTITHLLQNSLPTISGQVHCKKCEKTYNHDFNLVEKFQELVMFIQQGQDTWHNRAPERWTSPRAMAKGLKCKHCGGDECVKAVISEKKRSINWLFLLLGEFIGCCTLEQLKYFCKHAGIHRTGAKDRLIYLVYFDLCKQLQPGGEF